MFLVRPPIIIRKIFPGFVWKIPSDQKRIYITFDDGPFPETTPWILDTLQTHKAKATFFCIGDNVRKYPEIYAKILEGGHSVGNHTFNHLNGWKTKKMRYLRNFIRAEKYIKSDLFRPPYGKISFFQRKALGKKYKIIMWDVLSLDYDERVSEEKCLKIVLEKTRNGSVVVFHDSLKAQRNLQYVLPLALEKLSSEGYIFEPIYSSDIKKKVILKTRYSDKIYFKWQKKPIIHTPIVKIKLRNLIFFFSIIQSYLKHFLL